MTQLRDTSSAPPPEPIAAGDYDAGDPLASLHKMSTTAGISSQEYVAINIPSILALIVGLASVLAALSPVLLLVPAIGVATGLVSLGQIRASNGTQTGRAFALLGIVLSLVIGGLVLVGAVVERNRTAADRDTIVRQIEDIGRYLSNREYEKAYAMFSERFHKRIDRAAFDAVWDEAQKYPELGKIVGMQWNQTSILFQDESTSGARVATAYAWVHFEKGGKEKARHPFMFRKDQGKWVIEDAPQMFPTERRRPR